MLALSRALARPFRVLLIDELSRGLAAPVIVELYRVLTRLVESTDAAIVLVEHDLPLVFAAADVVHVLAGGRIVAAGNPSQVRADPATAAAFAIGVEP